MRRRHCPACMHAHETDASGDMSCGEVVGLCFCDPKKRCGCDECRQALVVQVHQAMQSAPHDGKPYRHARAAVSLLLGSST